MTYFSGFIAIVALFQLTWLFAYGKRRNDFADIAWGFGFVLSSWVACFFTPAADLSARAIVVVALVTVWGLRLTYHVGIRNLSKPKEDERYAKWRKEWGASWIWRSYLQVFVLQAVILFAIEVSILKIIDSGEGPSDFFFTTGCAIWLVGFLFEAIGDAQLKKFSSLPENRGQFITKGLWKYSRHPNYFGEVTQWWGFYFIACGVPGGWWTVVSPLTITFLILKVSGVPMLEDHMRTRAGFEDYARRISKFFPWPPKS